MENSKIVFLINDDVRAVTATYEEGRAAETFKTMSPDIKVDDIAVVQSTTRHGFTTVKVTAVDVEPNLESSTPIKWLVCPVDTASFASMIAEEDKAIEAVQVAERKRKRAALRQTMLKDHEDSINSLALANHADETVVEE